MHYPIYIIACLLLLSSCHHRDTGAHHQDAGADGPHDIVHPYLGHTSMVRVTDDPITDSLDARYTAYACDCPRWVDAAAYDSFYSRGRDTTGAMFDDRKYAYYIEPAGDADQPDTLAGSGLRLVLYGRIDTVPRYPKHDKFIDPDPPKGKVFVYSAYRILRPRTEYDSHYYDSVARVDSMEMVR